MAPVRILEGFLVGFHLLLLGHFFNRLGTGVFFGGCVSGFFSSAMMQLPYAYRHAFANPNSLVWRRIGHTLVTMVKANSSWLLFVPCQTQRLPLGLRA